jgi:hypothetical protein
MTSAPKRPGGWFSRLLGIEPDCDQPVTPQSIVKSAKEEQLPHEKMQVQKRQTRYDYSQGPAYYLGQQVVKAMEDAGYPAKIVFCYRSADHQAKLYAKGRTAPGRIVTKARPFESAHQYLEACDIVHPSKGWDVSEDYWDALAACVRIVAEKFKVELDHGHHWRFRDSAHFQLGDWRKAKAEYDLDRYDYEREFAHSVSAPLWRPSDYQLWQRFKEVLPEIAARIERDGRSPVKS